MKTQWHDKTWQVFCLFDQIMKCWQIFWSAFWLVVLYNLFGGVSVAAEPYFTVLDPRGCSALSCCLSVTSAVK